MDNVTLDASALVETLGVAPCHFLPRYRRLSMALRLLGARLVAPQVMPIEFGRTFLADPARFELRRKWQGRLGSHGPVPGMPLSSQHSHARGALTSWTLRAPPQKSPSSGPAFATRKSLPPRLHL
jgi:hypothetical protein